MPNPTMPTLAEAPAEALGGAVDTGTGIKHQDYGADGDSSPSSFSRLMNLERSLMILLAASSHGMAVSLESGLNVGVFGVAYMIGATEYAYAGDATYACTASQTNCLYLDSAQTLKNSTSGWPGGDHYKIAKVVCDGSAVTSVTDCRARNYLIGIVDAWYSVAAAGAVDFNDNGIANLKSLDLTDWAELTIAAGSITPTQLLHTVDTESDAASDDLTDITATAGERKLLLLAPENAARVVTVKSTGNITLLDGDYVLDDANKFILLIQDTDTTWVEVTRNSSNPSPLQDDLDANGKMITAVGGLNIVDTTTELTIASDAITVPGPGWYVIDTEADAGSDDLDTINGGTDGDMIVLAGAAGAVGRYTAVKSLIGNIDLLTEEFALANKVDKVLWLWRVDGRWLEIGRFPLKLGDLADTGLAADQVIPYPLGGCHASGALSNDQVIFNYVANVGFKLKRARGYVITAPSATNAIIDIQKNGASIFAADVNRIDITVATNEDTSDEVNVNFAVGDRLTVKVLAASSAADLTVSFDAYTNAKTPS